MERYFVINEANHNKYFIAINSYNSLMDYNYVNKIDTKVGIELYYNEDDYNELFYIERITHYSWHVIFAHNDTVYSASCKTLKDAKHYKEQKTKEGFRCRIMYASDNIF